MLDGTASAKAVGRSMGGRWGAGAFPMESGLSSSGQSGCVWRSAEGCVQIRVSTCLKVCLQIKVECSDKCIK